MGPPATRRACPDEPGQAPSDVLPGGEIRRRRGPATAALAAVLVLGAAAVDGWPTPADPVLALRAGALVPRDQVLDERRAEAGMHVEVVNTGRSTLHLREAALVPGGWEVDVVDRPLLVPGESVVLSLHRTVACSGGVPDGPPPEHLVLTARGDDERDVVVHLPVDDPAAYGGLLDDALRHPDRACVVMGDEVGGPLGDLVSSWRARRAWPPG